MQSGYWIRMSEMLSINVPDPLLERLTRLARAAQRPVEELVITTLNDSVPSPPATLSPVFRDELISLETLSDQDLLEVVGLRLEPNAVPTPYQPGDATDRLALRKAYALVLLKCRGHSLDELEGLAG